MRPNDRKYMESHEWAKKDGNLYTVGISDFAVEKLGELVFLDLPKTGKKVKKGERFGEIESVKAVSDLYSPVNGEIVEINAKAADSLETIGKEPFAGGWLIKIKPDAADGYGELLDAAGYEKVVEKES